MRGIRRSGFVLALVVVVLVILGIAGCSGSMSTTTTGSSTSGTAAPSTASSGGPAPGGALITEKNTAFDPSDVTIKKGETVKFVNADTVAHDVVINGQDLGNQDPGKTVEWTAANYGKFRFKCSIHSSMNGTVNVVQ